LGVDGCWCAPWSSKPVSAVKSRLGGFDSHIFPPNKIPGRLSAIFLQRAPNKKSKKGIDKGA